MPYENSRNSSSQDSPADAFPIVLDFVYPQGKILVLQTKTATAVVYLADYLDIPALLQKAKEFIAEDLHLDNAHIYYGDAINLHQDQLVYLYQAEQRVIARMIHEEVSRLTKLLDIFTVPSMMEILGADSILEPTAKVAYGQGPCFGLHGDILGTPSHIICHLSKLVHAFMQTKPISVEEFDLLTSEEYIPCVDISVATKLIEMEEKLRIIEKTQDTCLKKRCFQAIQENLHETGFDSPENEIIQFLRQRPPEIAVNTLVGCMKQMKEAGGEEVDQPDDV